MRICSSKETKLVASPCFMRNVAATSLEGSKRHAPCKDALAMYLREHADINPQEPIQQRPSSANIPAAYEDVIKVVEERGLRESST